MRIAHAATHIKEILYWRLERNFIYRQLVEDVEVRCMVTSVLENPFSENYTFRFNSAIHTAASAFGRQHLAKTFTVYVRSAWLWGN